VNNRGRWIVALFIVLGSVALPLTEVQADLPGNTFFERTWERTDYPVADGAIARTWMWGPEAFTPGGQEIYDEAPGGWRSVQYFDKSRMEVTDPGGDSDTPWFVTNGLLVVEMISSDIQYGHAHFSPSPRGPARVNVAGDADDPTGPTYETFSGHLFDPPRDPGTLITQRINRVGTVTHDASLASYNISAGFLDVVINHTVAAPFWDFMNSTGLVWEEGGYADDDLFLNPFYATGRPITEAYWANVKVAGTYQDVLMQCFERRCLTYTPDNDPNWQVEAGNVGRHYYEWRYGDYEATPPPPGLVLYHSDYENWTEWPAVGDTDERIFGDPAGSAHRCDGSFCIIMPGDMNIWTAARGNLPVYDDISVSVTLRLSNPVPGDRGCVMTHVVDSPTLTELYAFCLTGNDELIAFYYEETPAGASSTWLIPPGTVDSPHRAAEWNTLWISARGHDYWFYAGGILVGQATHLDGPTSGYVAIGAQRVAAAGSGEFGPIFNEFWVYEHQPRLP
jgi:hypothetical protein